MNCEADDRVAVLLPLPVPGPYDYAVAEGQSLSPGDFVRVPFGPRTVSGVVWGEGAGVVDPVRLKVVSARLPVPPLPRESRELVDWVARYTLSPPGSVLRMAMSVPAALEPTVPVAAYRLADDVDAVAAAIRMTPSRRRVIEILRASPPMIAADAAREAGVGSGVIRGMAAAGLLDVLSLSPDPAVPEPDWRRPGYALSPGQAAIAADLRARVVSRMFSVALLDGVPGSGKTEVYFEAVAEALSMGRQALVLLPEIALGAQWLGRFRARFGVLPLEWHSDLGHAARRGAWRAVAEGRAKVVVGARSALFLPFPDLGLIVVDEEHDASYKQEDGVIYNARDMAVVRARIGAIPMVPVSATPSLESAENARQGRYDVLTLPVRHAGAALPDVGIVDMRSQGLPATRWISTPLRETVASTLAEGEQALLFLNRRGYAPLTLCRRCGHRFQCPRCTTWLVEHRVGPQAARLQCHHCGFSIRSPEVCPECEAENTLAPCGPGVERLAEEIAEAFPDARIAVAASDTLVGPRAADDLVRRIEDGAVDIIVGTQIVAKGYHFPMLTLVGVVDADLGLAGGDLRAAERTFQLLYQVAGRAGRSERAGRVLIQTHMPEHPVIAALASGDRDRFMAAEADARREAAAPPFGRWAALIVSSPDEAAADDAARALARSAPREDGIAVLGPAPAPLALLRGHHRRRLLFKAPADMRPQAVLRRWVDRVTLPSRVRLRIDIDPYSFL